MVGWESAMEERRTRREFLSPAGSVASLSEGPGKVEDEKVVEMEEHRNALGRKKMFRRVFDTDIGEEGLGTLDRSGKR